MRDKVVSAAEAVAIIRSGDMVATSGFVGVGTPEAILMALEKRFLESGEPRDLGLLFAAAPGDIFAAWPQVTPASGSSWAEGSAGFTGRDAAGCETGGASFGAFRFSSSACRSFHFLVPYSTGFP